MSTCSSEAVKLPRVGSKKQEPCPQVLPGCVVDMLAVWPWTACQILPCAHVFIDKAGVMLLACLPGKCRNHPPVGIWKVHVDVRTGRRSELCDLPPPGYLLPAFQETCV